MAWTRNETASASVGRWGDAIRVVAVLWIAACSGVIAVGLNHMYPQAGARLEYAFREPSMDLDKPFESCAAAHAAGYYDIPRASPAYADDQDPDNDGIACEPVRGDPPPILSRLKFVSHRLRPVR